MNNFIPFNKPFLTGKEIHYINQSLLSSKISGDGLFTKKCHDFFEKKYDFKKCFLTTSCTDALEMAALLINIQPGDEVIMPSFTFVSTANAFILRGAKIIFCDSRKDNPNIDEEKIEELISERTKAIIPVHYAGIACNMSKIMDLAAKYNLFVIEDAAQSIDSFYTGSNGVKRPLGSIGHLATFSFHETKNIMSGEGGMIVVNDEQFIEKAEIIREKGTNRSKFFRGEIDKYGWVDIGSSFLPSDIIAAVLYAQLENLDSIQSKRKTIWNEYYEKLQELENKQKIKLPVIPSYATNNAHIFYLICKTGVERKKFLQHLKKDNINAVFHYQSLHQSVFYKNKHDGQKLPNSDYYSECLIRLPLYNSLTFNDIKKITMSIRRVFYPSK